MKRINTYILIALCAFAGVSCTKAENEPHQPEEEQSMIVYASTPAATKTSLDKYYHVLWSEGDQFKINNTTFTLVGGAGTQSGMFKSSGSALADGTYTARYPATYDGNLSNWPSVKYNGEYGISGAPMKATVTVQGGKISNIHFENDCAIFHYKIKGNDMIRNASAVIHKEGSYFGQIFARVTFDSPVAITPEGTIINIPVPELPTNDFTPSYATISFTATDGASATCISSVPDGQTLTFEAGKIYTGTLEPEFLFSELDPLPGVFSVSSKKKVSFSRGNLCRNNETGTFVFAKRQYETGLGNNYSSTFYHVGDEDYCCSFDYSELYDDDDLFTNDSGFKVNNVKGFYCLDYDEWSYLMNRKRDGQPLYATNVTVVGNSGCIILYPDNYTGTIVKNGDATSYSTYPFWREAEKNGVVCIAPSGYYQYWLSDVLPSSDSMYYFAHAFSPKSGEILYRYRNDAQYIRLVKNR